MCCNNDEHPIDLNRLDSELVYCQKVLLDLYNDKTITSMEFGNRLDELEGGYMKMKEGLCDMANTLDTIR